MPRAVSPTRQAVPGLRLSAPQVQNIYANGADLTLWELYEVDGEMDMTMYNPVTKSMGVTKITETIATDYHQAYSLFPSVYSPRFTNVVNKWFCFSAKVKAGTNKYVTLNPFFVAGDSYIIFDVEAGTIFADGSFEDPEAMTEMSGSIRPDGEGFMDIAFVCRLNPNGLVVLNLELGVCAVGNARAVDGVGGYVFQGTGLDFYCAAAQAAFCNYPTAFAYAGVDENVDNGDLRLGAPSRLVIS